MKRESESPGITADPGHQRSVLSVVARVLATICAIATAALTAYCGVLVYAATTFEPGSLPGPAVLSMVAVGVGLAAILCAGLTHLLWRAGSQSGSR